MFDYNKQKGKVSVIESLIGKSEILNVSRPTVKALNQVEDDLICTGVTDQNEILEEEVTHRLFPQPASIAQLLISIPEQALLSKQAS
ncbi:MAG: hypothetical protein NPIRA04_19020 [Nitrospirales bacterium]|nr:MAG: hypothetical protein NPIRA04_19020 [Nitrospirales bacterium]